MSRLPPHRSTTRVRGSATLAACTNGMLKRKSTRIQKGQSTTMSTSNFWLIRHGETKWNAGKRLQGWRDIALNETGIEQARHLAQHLSSANFTDPIDVIVSSDLSRAHETATIAAGHFGHPVVVTPNLRERKFGVYEGHSLVMQENGQAGLADFDLRCPHTPVDQGETLTQFAQRVQDAFEALATEYPGRNIM